MSTQNVPSWAYRNLALLVLPLLLGLVAFFMWFTPNPAIQAPCLALLFVYYAVVIRICKRNSGLESLWGPYLKAKPPVHQTLGALAGLVMFAALAFFGFYVTGAALLTTAFGSPVEKAYTVVAFYDPHLKRCDRKIILEGMSPVLGKGFCVSASYPAGDWVKGSRVILHGKESILGFRFTRIES